MNRSNFDQIQTISALLFGSTLLLLGLIIPLIVPANQKNEVLIMTFFFTLTGMLLLHSARTHKTPTRWLNLFGLVMLAIGLGTPLTRSQPSPDEFFFWTIAYMPVVIGGLFFTQWVAVRPHKPAPPPSGATMRRAPVQRMPEDMRYQRLLPVVLIGIFVFILISVGLVLVPALSVFLR